MNINILLTIALVWTTFTPLDNHRLENDSTVIEGAWVILEAELGGQKLPDENIKGAKLILDDGKYRFQNDQGEYKLYPGEKIKAMDIMGREGPNKGKTFLAIYEIGRAHV